MSRPTRTLLFSTLYPSSARPLHGIFVETRLRELLRHGAVQTRVVAPVPWYWNKHSANPKYAAVAATPQRETLHGIDVRHPRYLAIPKVGMTASPFLLALGARSALQAVRDDGFDFDVIDAHYYYPDGVAAALLARWFGKPLVITARGTDVNLIPNHHLPRRLIQWAAGQAQASVGVSAALVARMRDLAMDPGRLHLMRNGVDPQRFRPCPVQQARHALGLVGAPIVLTVGNLHEHKGQRLVLEAFAQLLAHHPQALLVIVGEGPDGPALRARAAALKLVDRVHFAGQVPNAELASWYSAADVLVLASSREGWPNVLLEAMACGTPVVGTAVGGIPEVVQDSQVGRLVAVREPGALAAALRELLAAPPDRQRVRAYAEQFSWDRTSQDQARLFESLALPQ